MSEAAKQFADLVKAFSTSDGVEAGQMFGKSCLKINGKAFVAQQDGLVVFKLDQPHHAKALNTPGAQLWDPSGKHRPMKEWVALPADASQSFNALAKAALAFVKASA
jgi:hypothetical protein